MRNMQEKEGVFSYKTKSRILFFLFLILIVLLYAFKNYSFFLRVASAIGFILIFYLADYTFKINFELRHYFYIFFISLNSFLFSPLFYIFIPYDKILHLLNPLVVASIIFFTVDKLKIKLKWKILFVFFIVAGIVGLFEIGEYILDVAFDWKMQGVYVRDLLSLEKLKILQDSINDTMQDMILGIVGGIIYSVIAILFYRTRRLRKYL